MLIATIISSEEITNKKGNKGFIFSAVCREGVKTAYKSESNAFVAGDKVIVTSEGGYSSFTKYDSSIGSSVKELAGIQKEIDTWFN
jgi:hypothetical protein